MASRVVREAYDVFMVGLDHHAGLYYFNVFTGLSVPPAPPVPLPPGLLPWPPVSFHPVYGSSRWWSGAPKTNDTVIADGDPIVSNGHEIKRNVHVPPGGNLLLPVTFGFSSSKWFIGVSSVIATQGPVASTIASSGGVNYNCQDPCSLFFPNVMRATSTVSVQPSAADHASAFGLALLQSVFELAISAFLESKLFHGLWSKLFGKLLSQKFFAELSEQLEKKIADAMAEKFAKVLKELTEKGVEDALGEALKKIAYGAFEDLLLEGPRRIFINILRGAAGDPIKFGVNSIKDWISDEAEKD